MPHQFGDYFCLPTVSPAIINFTTYPYRTIVGEEITATCCARGYPKPIISIDGNAVQTLLESFSQGVYEVCSGRIVTTNDAVPGSELTTTCNVVLAQTLNCTTHRIYPLSKAVKVSKEAVSICNAALKGNHSETMTNFIVGECSCIHGYHTMGYMQSCYCEWLS